MVEANGDRVTWSHDATYQLIREQRDGAHGYDVTFTYDAVGNRLTKAAPGQATAYAYDAANQLLTETAPDGSVATYTYDGCGNQATRDAAGALTSYTWDGENRLTVAALPDGARHTMTYDATGLRRRRETAAGTTLFVWDANDVLVETDAQGATQAAYTQTPALYGELVSQRRGEASSFFHFDGLGSTVGLTDADETETDSYLYHAFGEELAQAGATPNPFRFVGRVGYYDEAMLQLQYVRARWYAAGVGRWLARDPAGCGLPYAYARNAPMDSHDPSGELEDTAVMAICGGLCIFLGPHFLSCFTSCMALWDLIKSERILRETLENRKECDNPVNISSCVRCPGWGNTFITHCMQCVSGLPHHRDEDADELCARLLGYKRRLKDAIECRRRRRRRSQ